jgi:hypothetical protein
MVLTSPLVTLSVQGSNLRKPKQNHLGGKHFMKKSVIGFTIAGALLAGG